MECYAIERVDRTDRPHLTVVKRTYILTLSATRTFPSLHGITAETYVQRNRGFDRCPKVCDDGVQHIHTTYMDITHAYRSLFQHTLHLAEPILVLEDDTELMSTAVHDWPSVDRFLTHHEWMMYSLGTFGMVVPCGGGHWRYLETPIFGPIQSVIYSQQARARLVHVRPCEVGHVDMSVLSRVPHKYTFHRPLTHQKWRETANSRTWCIVCNDGIIDRLHRLVSRWLIAQSGLADDSENGFARVYRLHKLLLPLVVVCVAVCTYWALSFVDPCTII
jgi:hypothetical protein